jgi:hypothetical protein
MKTKESDPPKPHTLGHRESVHQAKKHPRGVTQDALALVWTSGTRVVTTRFLLRVGLAALYILDLARISINSLLSL